MRIVLEIFLMNLSDKLCSSGVYAVILFFLSFLSSTSQALDDGSWAYTLDGNAATITGRVNSCPADVNIPNEVDGYSVTKIGASAFYNSGVVTVKIPNTVVSIGGAAFASNSIASIDLPNGLTDIGSGAFSSNVLTNIIIPNTVVSIGGDAFSYNKLTSVVLPSGLMELPDFIFAHNALTSVAIPDSVITIKRAAFYSNAFTSIIIPKNVTSIGQLAFTYNEAAYYHFEGSRPEIHEEAFGTGLKLKRITYCDTEGWPGDEAWLFRARGRDKTLIYPTEDCDGYLPIPEHTFNADIAFVLKGYGGGTAIPNINSFNEEAQRVVAAIGALSLDTHSYEIFDGGIESRSMDDYLLSAEPEPDGLANAMMKDVRLPANHEKYKKIIYLWSTGVQYDNWAGGWAGGCRGFGLVDSEGQELENIHISQDYGDQCAFVDLRTNTSSSTKVMVHELTHLYGHGGHDSDSIESSFEYSMMHGSAYGPIDTYPIWNRVYITKWLTEENITEDRNQLTDYSGSSDKAGKYLLRLSEKNDFNCQDENRNPTRCHRYQELHKGTLIQNRGTFIRDGKSYFQFGVVFEPVMDVDDISTPSIESITVTNNVSTSEGIKDQITLVFSENITLGKGKITVYESDYSKEQGFSISVNRLPQNSDGWDGRGGTALADISGKNLIITSVMNGEKNYSIKFGQGSIIDWGGNSVSGKYCAFASDTDDTTDSDDDGIFDCADAFPLDASEIADNDSDGVGDNADTDADGDGINDSEDVFPLDASESLDTDGDGIGNNRDPNDDNDSHDDWRDIFPLDPSETTDTDSDGIGNNADSDDDDDGVSDNLDAYPLDSSEWSDTDGDGIGDNTEIDDDCDCVVDTEDAFPLDSTESLDSDADGVGNNADADDDNDDVLDGDDAFPLDSNESLDTDSDGTGNNADTDDDGDSVLDGDDAFPLDATESVDTDSDGVGNNADADDDGDGLDDVLEKSIGTNPFKRDSDFDSLSDKFEVDSKSRDPLVADYSLATGWNHTCVTSDLGVSCWAEDSLGRLIPPNNMGSVSQLSLGQSHSCALTKRDGKIYCWDDNGDQQLTLGSGFSQISAGGYHTCALKNEEIVCFGNNSDGQRDSPTLSNVSKVASGPSHACALANNKISCWGKNHFGQTDVPNLSNPVGLFSGGEGHVSCASHDDGWNCWGDESKVSLPPESLSKSADLAIGRNHMCAVDNNKVECWGDNYRNMSTPPDLSNPVQIELGTFHSCALSDSGVDCWGDSSRTSVPSSLRFGDFDGDSTPDDTDTDDDNDGVVDGDDAFPLDATESVDTDSDGIGNNADTDDDGDGVSDIDDTFPLDATESSDFDGDGVGDNTDLVNTTLTFSDGVFDISVKVNDPNDNPVSFIDLRFGAPSSHTCFINATATEIQSEGVYQANIKWAIGNNYTTQKYGVIDDSPVVHFSDGTKLYDQNQYYLDLTNLNSVAPQYKIESFQTAQTDIENEVEFEIIISGFGEDGFLLKYPTSSSGLLDIQVHFANNSDYVGVGFKQNEVEKIANDRYVMRGKVVISDPEDFMNPKLKLVSMCDASMNGKAWEQDSDQDSMIDVLDAFPQDSSEIYDTDSDGVGNNADTDDDNDSVLDGDDAFPLDATETLDTDGDGIGNNADTDDDNDGAVDSDDAFPLDSAESSDSDGDGLGDNADAFPNDSSETVDSDLDGIGDNADVFPNDPTESADTDLDGVGDNADAFPNDASETLDSDSDGTGDNADAFPNNALYKADSDLDGMPDAWETRYGLDPNDSSDATSDQDNDGVTALDEFLAGTIPSGSIDLDGNEDYDALTDGLLLLRGMFGLDGSALVTGTIASDATYTESVDIESRIETLGDLADIDGNGDIDALTDGLLTLRYLFGLQGDTLINGVVAVDATRKTAEEIEAHLETLMPAL